MASVKFGLTYNGPALDPSILSAIKASYFMECNIVVMRSIA
jgi:hypothetical protein